MKDIIRSTACWGMCALLALGGCDCEDRLRRALSDRGARGDSPSSDQGVGASQPSSTEPEEVEPNGRREQATRYELGTEVRALLGAIAEQGDEDWFLIGSARDELLEVRVEPLEDTLDVSVSLMSSDDTPLRYEVEGRGKAEVIPLVRIEGSRALAMKVSAQSGRGAYRIEFRRHLSAGVLEAEPNEIWGDAMSLSGAVELQGFYDRPGDRDRFMLAGEPEQVRRVEISGLEGISQRVSLVRDEQEVWARELAQGKGIVLPNLGGAGWGLELQALEQGFSRDVPYRLKISPVAAPAPLQGQQVVLEREPNEPGMGALTSYGALGVEHLVVVGSILDEHDQDHLGFTPSGGEVIHVALSSSGAGRQVWMKMSELGEPMWVDGEKALEKCMIVEAGRQEPIEVTLGGKPQKEGQLAAYRLEVWSAARTERVQGEEIEPNDEMSQATAQEGVDIPWTGRLLSEQDRDWYEFKVSEAEQLIGLRVEGHELDLMMSLRDEEGGIVAEAQAAGAGGSEQLEVRLPQGIYRVEVSAREGSSCEPYRLDITRK